MNKPIDLTYFADYQLPAEQALGTSLDVRPLAVGTYLPRYQAPDGTHGTLPLG